LEGGDQVEAEQLSLFFAADFDALELPAFFSAFSGELFAVVSAAAVPELLLDALL
jgi:hypothetical protein